MSRKIVNLSAIFLLSISFLFAGKAYNASAEEKDNTICKGVFIDEVDVSGMTKEEAKAAVDAFVEDLRSKGVAIMVGENMAFSTLGDIGYDYENNDSLDQALNLGKTGNLIKRYKDLKDIEQGSVVYPLTFTYDENKLKDLVTTKVSAYNIAPVNATLARKNSKFVYTDAIKGSKVDVNKTVALVEEQIKNWNRKDITVDAAMVEDEPEYTREDVEKCNTVLGTFSTTYVDSAEGRAANITNGARLINNTVLYPGEVFSSYDHLNPFTEENGYYIAGAYLQGKVIDSVGGGSCQVTTTLYNAVLSAELEVVQRQPHSMTISYVDLSRDAAIAGTYKDFKFMNSSDVPILIQSYTEGRKLTFKIWGNETRDTKNRTIKYVTKVISQTAPPKDEITKDPTLPTTYNKVTQSAHTGYKAELYKVVYKNGVEVSRTLVNKSTYSAAPRYITVGTKVVKDTDKKDTKKDNQTNDNQTNDNQTNEQTDGNSDTQTGKQSNSGEQKKDDNNNPSLDLE